MLVAGKDIPIFFKVIELYQLFCLFVRNTAIKV